VRALGVGVFVAFAALSVGCLPKPYGEGDPPSDPVDTEEPGAPAGQRTTGASNASGATGTSGSSSSTSGAASGSSGAASGSTTTPPPVLEPGQEMIFEKFEGTLAFAAKRGTLTVVAKGAGKAGRVCADGAGIGGIEATLGPVAAGTYTVTASVQQDTSAPGNTWTVEATSYAPGPDTHKNEGALAPSVKSVKSTVQVPGGAFAAVFAVRIGTTPGTCMLVDDIRIVKAP
jgi:hypothetical protein